MALRLITGPTVEPVSLDALKLHLRVDSSAFSSAVDLVQSIPPALQTVTDGYTLLGASVEVLGYSAVMLLSSGTNLPTGTVDVKAQHSENGTVWVDVSSGAFTQITTANDNATYELAYTGSYRYLRAVARVLLAQCSFSVSILRRSGEVAEDDLLTDIQKTAREYVERRTSRAVLTQTWEYTLPNWPAQRFFPLPLGCLQTVVSVTYTDINGDSYEFSDFTVEDNKSECSLVVLSEQNLWPTGVLAPGNPISVQFIAGWTTVDLVPHGLKQAIKMVAADYYALRGEPVRGQSVIENKTTRRLLELYRLRGWYAIR